MNPDPTRQQPVDLHTGRREERLARAAEHNRKVSRELVFFNRSKNNENINFTFYHMVSYSYVFALVSKKKQF